MFSVGSPRNIVKLMEGHKKGEDPQEYLIDINFDLVNLEIA